MQSPPRLHRQPATSPSLLVAAALLAFGMPSLMPFNLPPSPTVVNQLAAWVGWGALAWLACRQVPTASGIHGAGVGALAGALLLLIGAALVAPLWTGLPWGIALSIAGTLAAVFVLMRVGATVAGSGFEGADTAGAQLMRALMIGLVVVGLLHVAIAAVQVFAPRLADGFWIAAPASPGRASGNLRQPNHLSTLLLWSAIAAVWMVEAARPGRIRRAGLVLLAVFTLGVTLTASRTGALGVLLLAAWGLADRRLGRATRIALLLLPLAYLACWWLLSLWSPAGEPGFADRSGALGEDPTRLAIWANTIELIRAHPWAGVGVGGFNFAWTLTPFPDRPQLFFDHAHNVALQLLAELGLPLGTLVLALLGHALWRAFAAARAARGATALARRCALLLLLVAALHSLLEYPLWYAHFLLPVALLFGLCLGDVRPRVAAAPARRPWLAWAALALVPGGVLGLHDYARVAVIFAPGAAAVPLPERIAEGRRSWLFAHHADYARVTVAEPPPAPAAFDRVVHHLLDGRLMIAWARSQAASGDLPRAQHIVARLREFRQLRSDAFFAACAAPPVAAAAPFQCRPPPAGLSAPDFR